MKYILYTSWYKLTDFQDKWSCNQWLKKQALLNQMAKGDMTSVHISNTGKHSCLSSASCRYVSINYDRIVGSAIILINHFSDLEVCSNYLINRR